MSVTDLSTRPEAPAAGPDTDRAAGRRRAGAAGWWFRVGLVCAILVASGVVRARQAERIRGDLAKGLDASFSLESVPNTLGPWRGRATVLDPQIARGTGARQVVTRRYVNQDTGVAVDVILLFGPAVDMYVHTPEVCYPAAGFSLAAGPDLRAIPAASGPAPFRAVVYTKGEGGAADLQEVYYSWRYGGAWSPSPGTRKHFERVSGMYKVQVARRATGGERRDVGNPCESFLRALLPEMEARMPDPAARG